MLVVKETESQKLRQERIKLGGHFGSSRRKFLHLTESGLGFRLSLSSKRSSPTTPRHPLTPNDHHHHVGIPGHSAHAQVHPQPTARPQADGRVSLIHEERVWKTPTNTILYSDVLHPSRPNVSKDELREKLAGLYKMNKDQVSVFGFRTQFGGGKSTGFALLYDSAEAMKKFEPHYRLVRYGQANKIEKASRQQRTWPPYIYIPSPASAVWQMRRLASIMREGSRTDMLFVNRQATQEPQQGVPWYRKDQGPSQGQEEVNYSPCFDKIGKRHWRNGYCLVSYVCCIAARYTSAFMIRLDMHSITDSALVCSERSYTQPMKSFFRHITIHLLC